MPNAKASLLARDDTFLGVCEGLGEDLRISPLLLRLGFAFALFFNPVATVATYLALGLILAVARWIYPARAVEKEREQATPEPASGDNDQDWIELAEAA